MKKIESSATSIFVLAVVLFGLVAGDRANAGEKSNVLVIITDEHNFRTLGCYRDQLSKEQAEMWGPGAVVPTPNFDRLAASGVLCTRAYATSPVCSPCRAAMISGMYPHAVGVPTNDLPLDQSASTLADRMNEAGYRTGFVGKWHLGGTGKPEWSPGIDGGFQFTKYMFNRGHWKKLVEEQGVPSVGAQDKKGKPSYGVDGADRENFTTDFLTDRAINYMVNSSDQSQPFLMVISYPDPHGPNTVRAPYDHRFDSLRFLPPRTYETGIRPPGWLGNNKKHPVFRGADMSKYFGMVQCIDDNIGRMLKALSDAGELENTLIVMTSDHGDLCYEHDRQNKGNPYEGSARVPMIVSLPGKIPAGKIYRQPVGTVDLTPTVAALIDLPANKGDQGRNLTQELTALSAPDSGDTGGKIPVTFLRNAGTKPSWVAAVDSRYKLIVSTNDRPWLFDAQQDPDELLNFYRRPGTEGVAERLAADLLQYGRETDDPYVLEGKISMAIQEILAE